MLTEKELVHAKAVFTRMDDDNDGLVTHRKAMMAYKDWYSKVGAHGYGFPNRNTLVMQVVRSVPMKYQTKKQFTLVSPK
jgi:hypothetical protein